MNIAEKIGLLPFASIFADRTHASTLILCFLVTPIMLFVLGIVFESRILPILPNKQSPTFMPGDLFLAFGTCQGLILASKLPDGNFWYNKTSTQILLFIIMFIGVIIMFNDEISKAGTADIHYPLRAVLSPTKVYHDFVITGVFGYVVASTYIALIYNAIIGKIDKSELMFSIWPIAVWMAFLFTDGLWPREYLVGRAQGGCHVRDWKPFWER